MEISKADIERATADLRAMMIKEAIKGQIRQGDMFYLIVEENGFSMGIDMSNRKHGS